MTDGYTELLIGAGSTHAKRYGNTAAWQNLVTLDINPSHEPDVVHDLNVRPLPFADNAFDEVHAYEIIEHLGRQGDYRAWFDEWSEWWRILKPGGLMVGTSPHYSSPWAWMDPGHTRAMGPEMMVFLSQAEYTAQVGKTPMSDYRFCYRADFDPVQLAVAPDGCFQFVMRAVKPARIAQTNGSPQ